MQILRHAVPFQVLPARGAFRFRAIPLSSERVYAFPYSKQPYLC